MTLRKLRKLRSNRAGWNHFFMQSCQFLSVFGVDDKQKYPILTVGWRELKDL